jgi:hypothetical protein
MAHGRWDASALRWLPRGVAHWPGRRLDACNGEFGSALTPMAPWDEWLLVLIGFLSTTMQMQIDLINI